MSNEEMATRTIILSRNLDLGKDNTFNVKNYAELRALNNVKNENDDYGSLPLQSTLIHTLRREATLYQDRIYRIVGLLSNDERARVKIDYNVSKESLSGYYDGLREQWQYHAFDVNLRCGKSPWDGQDAG
jgi:hypothetical protein